MSSRNRGTLKRRHFTAEPDKHVIIGDVKVLVNKFLNDRSKANNVLLIINKLKSLLNRQKRSIPELIKRTSGALTKQIVYIIQALEVLFKVLLKRLEMHDDSDLLPQDSKHTKRDYTKEAEENMVVEQSSRCKKADSAENRNSAEMNAIYHDSVTRYRLWLKECYDESLDLLLHAMEYACTPEIIKQAVGTYMTLISEEAKAQMAVKCNAEDEMEAENFAVDEGSGNGALGNKNFPLMRLKNLLMHLASADKCQIQQTNVFCNEYVKYKDVIWHTWTLLQLPLLTWRTTVSNEMSALNIMSLLHKLPPPPNNVTDRDTYLCCPLISFSNEITERQKKTKQWQRIVNRIWRNIMSWTYESCLSIQLHRSMVLLLVEQFLAHLDNPIKLTDFLVNSLDAGGSTAVVALQGIYNLVQTHNITYPQLYGKLYKLFTPQIFEMRSKVRLYSLADSFLKSTHLSEKIVASFVKRFARLCLVAPPPDIIILSQFMQNLILRHPKLKYMIPYGHETILPHRTEEMMRLDYFNNQVSDPYKTGALLSTLWEMSVLQHHASSSVAAVTRPLSDCNLPQHEWDLSEIYDLDEVQIFQTETDRENRATSRDARNNSLFAIHDDDQLQTFWDLF